MNTMVEILSLIVGGCVAGVIGIAIAFLTKFLEEKRTERYVSRAILLEVEINQKRLQRLFDIIDEWEKGTLTPQYGMDPLEKVILRLREPVADGTVVSFDRTIYLSSSYKIGLLNSKIGEKVVQYYAKIAFVEGELNRDIMKMPNVDLHEINLYVKAAYKMGEELIKSLNK